VDHHRRRRRHHHHQDLVAQAVEAADPDLARDLAEAAVEAVAAAQAEDLEAEDTADQVVDPEDPAVLVVIK
jgi:hypothetical protein